MSDKGPIDTEEHNEAEQNGEPACRRCGRRKWRIVTIREPVDRSYLFSRAEQDIEFRVCECGYAEKTDADHPRFPWQKKKEKRDKSG